MKIPAGYYKSGFECVSANIPYTYYIGKFEVTNQQFVGFLRDAIASKSVYIKNNTIYCTYREDDKSVSEYRIRCSDRIIQIIQDSIILDTLYKDHPVTGISYYGCLAFCSYYHFNLPTESEWEKAARGNNCKWYPWGNEIDSSYANYFSSNDPFEPGTTPVGFYNGMSYNGFQTSNAASAYGCYDMAGNAWEWTATKFNDSSMHHLGKGGGYSLHLPYALQVHYVSTFRLREQHPASDQAHMADGFRVVKRGHQ